VAPEADGVQAIKGGDEPMAISRWDPFRDLMSIQNELNRLFGRTYAGSEGGVGVGGAWVPPMDIYETEDKFVVSVELAGVDPEAVEVSVEDSTLTVSGERSLSREIPEEQFHRVERRYGQFVRSLSLPPTANADGIEASFDRGVLTIEVPKVEQAKPRRITVKATE
jgi:HSP20 family protein